MALPDSRAAHGRKLSQAGATRHRAHANIRGDADPVCDPCTFLKVDRTRSDLIFFKITGHHAPSRGDGRALQVRDRKNKGACKTNNCNGSHYELDAFATSVAHFIALDLGSFGHGYSVPNGDDHLQQYEVKGEHDAN